MSKEIKPKSKTELRQENAMAVITALKTFVSEPLEQRKVISRAYGILYEQCSKNVTPKKVIVETVKARNK